MAEISFVWKSLSKPEFGVMNSVSELVRSMESREPELLTNLRLGSSLLLVCDYSGQHKRASHETYTFLLADSVFLWLWNDFRLQVRSESLQDGRRMSFKGLNDSKRQDALVTFLRAANCIPGVLFSFVVEKKTRSLFRGEIDASGDFAALGVWPKPTLERFLRMAHFGSLLISCLSAPDQDIDWITDEDDIAANDERITEGTKALGAVLSQYLSHSFGRLRYGSTRSSDESIFLEDLAAIPDLAAGAINEIACDEALHKQRGSEVLLTERLSAKTRCIAGWLADQKLHTLKRLTVYIELGESNSISARLSALRVETPIPDFMWMWNIVPVTTL